VLDEDVRHWLDRSQIPLSGIMEADSEGSFNLTDMLKPSPAYVTGPSWQRRLDGRWHLPDKTLGWDLLDWFSEYVKSPSGEEDEPFIPTDEQARFLLWWYAVDQNGRYAYRNGVLRRMKGWGKDPLVAAMSLAELCGPVHFAGWNPITGQPFGKQRPAAWIQIAAVAQDQTQNTFLMFPLMITDKLKKDYKLDVNKTIIYADGGRLIQGVTSNPYALEGKRPTFVIMNEIQWWFETNEGHRMYKVIDGNVTKRAGFGSRHLAICNAHVPGQDSVGEMMWDNYQKVLGGEYVDTGILYDALEAPADTPLSDIPPQSVDPEGFKKGIQMLYDGIKTARGDSVWLDIESIVLSCLDGNNEESESRRKFLNQIDATEDAWITPWEWDSRHLEAAALEPKDKITVGFDGSKSNDFTAIVACRVSDGCLFLIKMWDPKNYGGTIPRDQVDATIDWVFSRYTVVGFRADVKEFESYVDSWTVKYKKNLKVKASPDNPIAFDMRSQTKRFALDCERFHESVIDGGVYHNGGKQLRQHVLNAHRHPTTYDAISIRKASKDSPRKIDAAVCAVLAYASRMDYLMKVKKTSGRVAIIR
jgi:hypothetical protein